MTCRIGVGVNSALQCVGVGVNLLSCGSIKPPGVGRVSECRNMSHGVATTEFQSVPLLEGSNRSANRELKMGLAWGSNRVKIGVTMSLKWG